MGANVTQESMDYAAHVVLLPVTLLINFSLFQYLVGLFFARRAQPLTLLLLLCAFVGFAALIPFSVPDEETFEYLNDISETASTLTFLVQIVIIGRDITKKVKVRSLMWMTYVAEGVIILEMLLILATMIKLADPALPMEWIDDVDKSMQAVSLWLIFGFRFYYIGTARGFRKTFDTKKGEIALYLLFATNEYPFMVLEALTDVPWDPVQAFWHRFTLMLCILYTIREKVRSGTSKGGTQMKTGASRPGTSASKASKHSMGPHEQDRKRSKSARSNHASKGNKGPSVLNLARLGGTFRSSRSILPVAITVQK